MLIGGIYLWINKITNTALIGQTSNFKRRKREYLSRLNNNKHNNAYFQNAWNKYGASNFEFIILQYVDIKYLTSYEQSYLNYYKSLPGGTYNQVGPVDSPRRGIKYDKDLLKKLSISHLGKSHSLETKRKISTAQSNNNKNKGYYKQITKYKNKEYITWTASFVLYGKKYYLGSFDNEEAARSAVEDAKSKIG